MKYIDADRLKAEIEKNTPNSLQLLVYRDIILALIDSLQQEQPCEDLEEEMDRFFEEMPVLEHENIFEDTYQMIARHFYELGLKAKEE